MNVLPRDKQVQIISALIEGCSIRSVERMHGVHRDTIMRLGVAIGERCAALHDHMMRDLHVTTLELDELWSFVGCKQKNASEGAPNEGDQYIYTALAANQRAIVSYAVGKRNATTTRYFVNDVRARVLGRPQITTDAFPQYVPAMEAAFAGECDFATLEKVYAGEVPGRGQAAVRYSPGQLRGTKQRIITGSPNPARIATSYVERSNLSARMTNRRLTRLTNAFSKKLRNHRAAVALMVAAYNLVHVVDTLRETPAMALGLTDRPWAVAELVDEAMRFDPIEPIPTLPPEPPKPISPNDPRYRGGERRGNYVKPWNGQPGCARFRA